MRNGPCAQQGASWGRVCPQAVSLLTARRRKGLRHLLVSLLNVFAAGSCRWTGSRRRPTTRCRPSPARYDQPIRVAPAAPCPRGGPCRNFLACDHSIAY